MTQNKETIVLLFPQDSGIIGQPLAVAHSGLLGTGLLPDLVLHSYFG